MKQWCEEDAVSHSACLNIVFGVVGEDREQLNAVRLRKKLKNQKIEIISFIYSKQMLTSS